MRSEASKKTDTIQKEVEKNIMKEADFIRKGRNFNRKTQDGMTQVVTFELYKKYPFDPTLLSVLAGIRIPECSGKSFDRTESSDVFAYSDCTLSVDMGKFKGIDGYRGYSGFHYCLDKGDTKQRDENERMFAPFMPKFTHPRYKKDFYTNNDTDYEDRVEDIISDISDVLIGKIFPFFSDMDSRDKILQNTQKYKKLNIFGHLWELETVFIYGARGDIEKAKQVFNKYYKRKKGTIFKKANEFHIEYLDEIAKRLDL